MDKEFHTDWHSYKLVLAKLNIC